MAQHQSPRNNNHASHYSVEDFLKRYAYYESGANRGNPDTLSPYLMRIFEGDLIEASFRREKSAEEIKQINDQILALEQENAKMEAEIEHFEKEDIPAKRKKIEKLDEEIDGLQQEKIELPHNERFKPYLFGIYLLGILLLSIFLYFFYVSIIYEAVAGTKLKITGAILPDANQLRNAISHSPLILFAPSLVAVFGLSLHIFLEQKNKIKYLYIGLVLLIAFVLDWLIAHKIHLNIQNGLCAFNPETCQRTSWYTSSDFYIVLTMGFLGYIFWSVVLHALLEEWKKRNVKQMISSKIEQLRNRIEKYSGDIEGLIKKKQENEKLIKHNKIEMKGLEREKSPESISLEDKLRFIDTFVSGWNEFLKFDEEKIKEVNRVKQEFINSKVQKRTHQQ